MPFTIDDKWQIMTLLEVNDEDEIFIEALLDKIARTSERKVQHVLNLAKRLNEGLQLQQEAASGLIQAGEVRWKDDRYCQANRYVNILRRDLARAIGYEIKRVMPW